MVKEVRPTALSLNPSQKPSVFFLYTELGGYTLACMKKLASTGVDVHVVHFPVNNEAPFKLDATPGLLYYQNSEFSREELLQIVRSKSPSLIVCSGWVDKNYLYVCRKMRGSCQLALAIDNQWRSTWKQRFGSLFARWSFIRYFDHIWVPGKRQVTYARKMGVSESKVHTGFYCCDVKLYEDYYQSTSFSKRKNLPKRFLYVGRYFDYKGVSDLWEAFSDLHKEFPNEWELWCVGMGDLVPPPHPSIRHFGFVQPNEMVDVIRNTSVFVMPSRFDQWGVALQEFCIAGYPVLCSDRVGASDTFLEEGVNGFGFTGEDISGLKEAMKRIVLLEEEQLHQMGERSHLKGLLITPESWLQTVNELMKNE
jgi:glycosyltransferase involved in cell wall biosynthesis